MSKMRKPNSFLKIGTDLFSLQLMWTFWALGIFIIVNILRLVFLDYTDSLYSGGYIAANIYMLVIGILAFNFLKYYVENGVTRKTFFFGNLLASVGLSIVIPILIYAMSFVEKILLNRFTSIVLRDDTLDKAVQEVTFEISGNFIGEVIQSLILTPFINPESSLVLSLALFSLHIFMFYIVGWLIGSAFYRLKVIGGLLFIAIGIILIMVKDSLIRLSLDLPLFQNFSMLEIIPTSLAVPLTFVVGIIAITLIYFLTYRAPIKI